MAVSEVAPSSPITEVLVWFGEAWFGLVSHYRGAGVHQQIHLGDGNHSCPTSVF